MKKFATELRGKTVMTKDGQILGMIENLVIPAEEIEPRLFKTDAQGRLMLPFNEMKAIRDVVVMDIAQ
jgi:sporulation protein YlmC with PRC-barrel domain